MWAGCLSLTPLPHRHWRALPLAPDAPCSGVQVAPMDIPSPHTSLPGQAAASLPTQMTRAGASPAAVPPCSSGPGLSHRQPRAHLVTLHPHNHTPPASSKPGPGATRATYLSLPFALAGATRILTGGPLCGLWGEHTDVTWLWHSWPGQAAVRVGSGPEAGKGSMTACRVRVSLTTSTWTQRAARDL